MAQSRKKSPGKRSPQTLSKLKLVVEVDGKRVGVLDIDWNRLWPEVNHRKRESAGIEWIRSRELDVLAKATMLERFTRLDGSRSTRGSGLGLSLVAAVAKLHDASLELGDNNPGLIVTLSFAEQEPGGAPTLPSPSVDHRNA